MKSVILFFLLLTTVLLKAQPGTLDISFGNKGTLIKESSNNFLNETVKVTKEGRVLIGTVGSYGDYDQTFRIDALLPNGSSDTSFGDKGSSYAMFQSTASTLKKLAYLYTFALLPDGKILAAGTISAQGAGGNIGFARFTPDGNIDSSFGTNGVAVAFLNYEDVTVNCLSLQEDGRFLIGGAVLTNFQQNTYQAYTARFLMDGKPDLPYGNEGFILGSRGAVNAIAVQSDGKISACGYFGNVNSNTVRFHIERYNTDGSYDISFGTKGIVNTQVGSDGCVINDAVIQQDGRLVVTGSSGLFEPVLTVARYNTDGILDNTFGKEGITTTLFPQYNGEGKRVFLTGEKKDKIVVAGSNRFFLGDESDFAIVGYNGDGSLDTEFGNKGIETTSLTEGDYTHSADVQPDGKIILIGTSYTSSPFSINRALARYNGYPVKVSLIVRVKRWLQNHTLSWKGLPAEDKIAYYTVEQSNSAAKGFIPVAKVSGVSNLKDYSITNSHLLQGSNYYRIKAISTDGVIRYSEVVSADNTANTASVFPNPAKNYVTVQGLSNNETANISIKDGSGTVLARGVSTGSGQYRSQLGSNMQPGTYYLNITTGSKTEVLKFVKE